jgi:hypothetical protein
MITICACRALRCNTAGSLSSCSLASRGASRQDHSPISHTIRVIRNLVFSIFIGEVRWCDWTVRMGEFVCVGRLVRAKEIEPSRIVVFVILCVSVS